MKDLPEIGGIIISRLITDNGEDARLIFREPPINESDSGWRILSGLEDEEYANDSNNFIIYGLSSILEIEKDLLSKLLEPTGAVFERESKSKKWKIIYDFPLQGEYVKEDTINNDWRIKISNIFDKYIQDEEINYVAFQKTVRIRYWKFENKTKDQLFKNQLEKINNRRTDDNPIIENFDYSTDEVKRVGFIVVESNDEKEYKVLYNYIMIDEEVIQCAIYFDDDIHKDWAIKTWLNIKKNKNNV